MELDQRKQRVLRAIIIDYISTAEPVGSRTLAKKYDIGVSSATIRNEMSDLEEMGYLEQPHTSAGRVPSDRGYRFYVDSLMEGIQLEEQEVGVIKSLYKSKVKEFESVVKQTARVLSQTSDYLALVQGPRLKESVFRYLQLLPLSESKALLVLVTEDGFVQNKVIDVHGYADVQELQSVSVILNNYLQGHTLGTIGRGALRNLLTELSSYQRFLKELMEGLEDSSSGSDGEKIYLGGTANIIKQPEFQDVVRLQNILSTLEQESLIYDLLSHNDFGRGISIQIGGENSLPELQECSIVSATYTLEGKTVGKLAVIGPKRMNYPRVIALVDVVTRSLSEFLADSLR